MRDDPGNSSNNVAISDKASWANYSKVKWNGIRHNKVGKRSKTT